jgi:hypothetical protein
MKQLSSYYQNRQWTCINKNDSMIFLKNSETEIVTDCWQNKFNHTIKMSYTKIKLVSFHQQRMINLVQISQCDTLHTERKTEKKSHAYVNRCSQSPVEKSTSLHGKSSETPRNTRNIFPRNEGFKIKGKSISY